MICTNVQGTLWALEAVRPELSLVSSLSRAQNHHSGSFTPQSLPSKAGSQCGKIIHSNKPLQQACSPEGGGVSEAHHRAAVIGTESCCALPGFSPGVTAGKTGRARLTKHRSVCAPPFQSAGMPPCRDQIATPVGCSGTVFHFPEGRVLPSQITESPETMNGNLWRRLEVFQLGICP